MTDAFKVIDNFCPQIDRVRASALESGFGTWRPNKGDVGSSVYEGMSFWGLHSHLLYALTVAMGCPVFPNNMFFRYTNLEVEKTYVHSDRMWGSKTCIVYLSDHAEVSGTGFYRHRRTGLMEMPPLEELKADGRLEQLKVEMVEGSEKDWEQIDFVRGLYNRALIFHAPLFHCRSPKTGFGTVPEEGRMIWACHFHTAQTLNNQGGGASAS